MGSRGVFRGLSAEHASIGLAISLTTPAGPGLRNRMLMDFARRLRGLGFPAEIDDELSTALAGRWYAAVFPFIRTKRFDSTVRDLRHALSRVEIPISPEVAHLSTLVALDPWLPGVRPAVDAVAKVLKAASGIFGPAFFLDYRAIAAAAGLGRMTTYRACDKVVEMGWARRLDRGIADPEAKTATTWEWIGPST
ncbi:MAG: hypothetical protein ABS79_03755 [Planctomycetes bacterium SCN 63-9]|nr:MAG: hypothetical protein ABS79_03755 [Planctomycetes bacterium SCN 63-9]